MRNAPGARRRLGPCDLQVIRGNDPEAAARILASLPEWFGIPEANEHYIKAAAEMPSYLAVLADTVVGVLLLPRHFDRAAEVYLIAVDAEHRSQGVGTSLLDAAEPELQRDGVRLLQVKTLGPSRVNAYYEQTRMFYEGREFEPLEELQELWDENPCLIMVKML